MAAFDKDVPLDSMDLLARCANRWSGLDSFGLRNSQGTSLHTDLRIHPSDARALLTDQEFDARLFVVRTRDSDLGASSSE